MKLMISKNGLIPAFLLSFLPLKTLSAEPVVSEVFAKQRAGTKLVDINYTLLLDSNLTAYVGMWFSSDNGLNYLIKCESVTGDIGAGISSGNKSVVWDAGADWDERFTNNGKIRVIAREGNIAPDLNSSLSTNNSHSVTIEWDLSLGGTNDDKKPQIVHSSDNQFIIAGHSKSEISGDKSQSLKGSRDFWVVGIDSNGTKLCDKDYGSTGSVSMPLVTSVKDSKFILAGWSSGDGFDKTTPSKGGVDFWFMQIDVEGNKNWDRTIGGTDLDAVESVCRTIDGGICLAGYSVSNKGHDKSEDSRGEQDFWIVKTDSNETKLWDKTYGGSSTDYHTFALIEDINGNLIFGGSSKSSASGDKSEDSRGAEDFWIVKTDSNGTKLWDKTYGGSGQDEPKSMVLTDDGGLLIGGTSNSDASGDKSEDSRGGKDFWIVKTDSNGTKLWDKTIGGSQDDILGAMVLTDKGDLLIAGESRSDASGDKSEDSRGGQDFWIVKTDSNGTKLWDKTIGGTENDKPDSMVLTDDGGLLIVGNSLSSDSGDKSKDSRGMVDFWVVKLENVIH